MRIKAHVDDFIDSDVTDAYASWVLYIMRLPASLQIKFRDQTKHLKLFCEYKGRKYRVTGASRLGDVWLHSDFTQDTGYEKRVDVGECGEWGPEHTCQ